MKISDYAEIKWMAATFGSVLVQTVLVMLSGMFHMPWQAFAVIMFACGATMLYSAHKLLSSVK